VTGRSRALEVVNQDARLAEPSMEFAVEAQKLSLEGRVG